MKVTVIENALIVEREAGDKGYYNSGWSNAESILLSDIQKYLNQFGYDLIKKRMWKDGHMVCETQQYLRTRSKKVNAPHIYIYNSSYSVYDAGKELMEHGKVTLQIDRDVFA